jgi:hypothetical protein
MDKKYQVFLSSTFKDLVEERQEVIQALLELDCIPVGMELFPAADDDQWTLIKRLIDDCDYYILIIGGRYGSTNKEGISYTQMEYEYALNKSIPIISFLHKNPENIVLGKSEQDPNLKDKLVQFKNLVQQKMVKYFETPVELGSVVSRSLIKLIKEKDRPGWVRATNLLSDEAMQELLELRVVVDNYKRQLQLSDFEIPKGSEELAQGDDVYNLQFYSKNDYSTFGNTDNSPYQISLTWNQIFATISPLLIDEAFENSLVKPINDLILKYSKDIVHQKKQEDNFDFLFSSTSYGISSDTFHTILIQFKALRLIQKSDKKRSIKDKGNYWMLTHFGDNLMTKLRAIKK